MEIGLGEINPGVGQSVGGDADRANSKIEIAVFHGLQIGLCTELVDEFIGFVKAVRHFFPDLHADPLNRSTLRHDERWSTTDANA